MIQLGETFVNKEAPGILSHLWMVLSDPKRGPKIVIANLSTRRQDEPEHTCVVRPKEHPYVSKESVVRLDQVRVAEMKKLEEAQRNGLLSPSAPLSIALLARIQKALGESPLVPNEAKEILRAQGFIRAK